MKRSIIACAFVAAALVSGCGRQLLYEWRDEPYLRKFLYSDSADLMECMHSRFADNRDIACRLIGMLAREARKEGDREHALSLGRILMDHFLVETNDNVKTSILVLGLRDVGAGFPEIEEFLKARLERLELPVSAAHVLAVHRAPGSYEAIERAYEATDDYSARQGLLEALWILGDSRAIAVYERAIGPERPAWPPKIHHQSKAMYMKALELRLRNLQELAHSS